MSRRQKTAYTVATWSLRTRSMLVMWSLTLVSLTVFILMSFSPWAQAVQGYRERSARHIEEVDVEGREVKQMSRKHKSLLNIKENGGNPEYRNNFKENKLKKKKLQKKNSRKNKKNGAKVSEKKRQRKLQRLVRDKGEYKEWVSRQRKRVKEGQEEMGEREVQRLWKELLGDSLENILQENEDETTI